MVKPVDRERITIKDLRQCQMASNFFNVLFNLNKFIAMEQKDPFMSRGEEPESSFFDRFVAFLFSVLFFLSVSRCRCVPISPPCRAQ